MSPRDLNGISMGGLTLDCWPDMTAQHDDSHVDVLFLSA